MKPSKRTALTDMQKRYIWLMGSYPQHVAEQGRGYRTKTLYYGFREDRLFIFGYSMPLYFLEGRGLTRELQDGRSHVLTEAGERAFQELLVSGFGLKANVQETKLAPRNGDG